MLPHKHSPARTYTRSIKSKEEVTSILGLSSGEIPVEYEAACRLCLNKTDNMVEIFGDLDSIVPISVKIKNLLGLETCEEDRLPSLICENCLNQLNDGYNFKKRCLASDVKLRQYLCTPLKALDTYFELKNDDNSREPDSNESSEENLFSLRPVKAECTIDWNDEVPLAGIISSAETSKDIYAAINSHPAVEVVIHSTEHHPAVDVTNEHPFDTWNQVVYGNSEEQSNDKVVENPPVSNVSKQVLITLSPKRNTPNSVKTHEPPKPFKVVKNSGYVCKMKPVETASLDDVPLADRLRMDEESMAILSRTRKRRVNKNSESQVEVEIIEPSQREVRSTRTESSQKEGRPLKVFSHICPICSKAFMTPSLLARHLRIHTGEKPFRCTQCSSAFTQKEILKRHIAQIHTTVKLYKCKHCNKSYGSYNILAGHIRTVHVKYGQYRCKLCSKIFRHASGLSRHQNYHNGTYFYCKICGKHFNDGSSVKRHIKVHTNQ